MTFQQLQQQLQRILSIKEMDDYILLNVIQTFHNCSKEEKRILIEGLKEYITQYIKDNSPFSSITPDNIEKIDFFSIMGNIIPNINQLEELLKDQEVSKDDIVYQLRKVIVEGYLEENILTLKTYEQYKESFQNNPIKDIEMIQIINQIRNNLLWYQLQEQQDDIVIYEDELLDALEEEKITSEQYSVLSEYEQIKLDFVSSQINYLEEEAKRDYLLAQCNIQYLTVGYHIAQLLQQYQYSNAKVKWLESEMKISQLNYQYASGEITEEEKRTKIGEELLRQIEIEEEFNSLPHYHQKKEN